MKPVLVVAAVALAVLAAAAADTGEPRPFVHAVAPHRLQWGIGGDGRSFERSFRVVMGRRVRVRVRGVWTSGTVTVRVRDAARRLVFARRYTPRKRPTAVREPVRGRPGRWTFTFAFRAQRGGPFLFEATG